MAPRVVQRLDVGGERGEYEALMARHVCLFSSLLLQVRTPRDLAGGKVESLQNLGSIGKRSFTQRAIDLANALKTQAR